MTESAVVHTFHEDPVRAGIDLADQMLAAFKGESADAVVLFASARYDYPALLTSLTARCHPKLLVGCSSAGEFTNSDHGEGRACALAIRSSDMHFAAGIGRGLAVDRGAAAQSLVQSFHASAGPEYSYRTALIMTDALAGHADDLLEQLTLLTSGMHQFVGGGAGDDARFKRTHVFFGTEAATDAAVALEILSRNPVGVGIAHGWEPASRAMRVTAIDGMNLVSLNGLPAVDAFEEHAEATDQQLNRAAPLSFFLHNILGIETAGGYQLRVPLSILEDGSVACAAEIPLDAKVYIMKTSAGSAVSAAASATRSAIDALNGRKPKVALFFDCVATRLRLNDAFGDELKAVEGLLGDAEFVGCNTYGQIGRAEGQFGGFHNCTAVVCVLPE